MEELPIELKLLILTFLDQPSLLQIQLVSRQYHSLASHTLFQNMIQENRKLKVMYRLLHTSDRQSTVKQMIQKKKLLVGKKGTLSRQFNQYHIRNMQFMNHMSKLWIYSGLPMSLFPKVDFRLLIIMDDLCYQVPKLPRKSYTCIKWISTEFQP
jgi:hypothetical protein